MGTEADWVQVSTGRYISRVYNAAHPEIKAVHGFAAEMAPPEVGSLYSLNKPKLICTIR